MSSIVPVSNAITPTPRESPDSNVNNGIESGLVVQAIVGKLGDFSANKKNLVNAITVLQCRSRDEGIDLSSKLNVLRLQLIDCWKDVINYWKGLSEDVKEGLYKKLPRDVLGIYCLVKYDYCLAHLDGNCPGRDFCGKTHLDPIPKCANF